MSICCSSWGEFDDSFVTHSAEEWKEDSKRREYKKNKELLKSKDLDKKYREYLEHRVKDYERWLEIERRIK